MTKIKKLSSTAIIPLRGTDGAAGFDLYSNDETAQIEPGKTVPIHTGIAIELSPMTAGLILARSGLATKRGLRPANCVGLIDPDYRGELIVALHNDSDEVQVINNGDRIAQLMVCRFETGIEIADELSDTERGGDGFGSTGIR